MRPDARGKIERRWSRTGGAPWQTIVSRARGLRELKPLGARARNRRSDQPIDRRAVERCAGAGRDRFWRVDRPYVRGDQRRPRLAAMEYRTSGSTGPGWRDDAAGAATRDRSSRRPARSTSECPCRAGESRGHPALGRSLLFGNVAGRFRTNRDQPRIDFQRRGGRLGREGAGAERSGGAMKIVVFGLTISSSWGNGHATLWRGLCRGLAKIGHHVVFYERDVPYYAGARDLHEIAGGELILYPDWDSIQHRATRDVADADVAMVTSYCPDAAVATDLVTDRSRLSVFYDLDTPITLMRLRRAERVDYIGARGLADFDLVLSYTGGIALDELRSRLRARRVAPLYGHVDPAVHRPADLVEHYHADLS